MIVLYIGQLSHGGTCAARSEVLQVNGFTVIRFDITPYTKGNRLVQSLQHRLLDGPQVRQLNHDLLNFASQFSSVDAVWVDKGRWIFPKTLEALRKRFSAILVHYTPDPAFSVHTSRHFINGLKFYDLVITTKRYEVEKYRAFATGEVLFSLQGVDERFARIDDCSRIDSSRNGAVFIGHCEDHYIRQLGHIASAGLPIGIWGAGWTRAAKRYSCLDGAVKGVGIFGDPYVQTLATGAVGIGLLSKLCPDAYTTRTFEIPASGALLLAEDTPEHRELYAEGDEAEFFSSHEELVDKLAYYLANDVKRINMARKARDKTLQHYTWAKVLNPALNNLARRIHGRTRRI